MIKRIAVGRCYRIAGRSPLVVLHINYDLDSKRTIAKGYTPAEYKRYMKFHMIGVVKSSKTVAEIEGTAYPEIHSIRFNSKSKIEELDMNVLFADEPFMKRYSTGEIDQELAKVRK